MKNYFILLCLLLSGGLASAATQATLSQDKPARLHVVSYTMKDSGSEDTSITDLAGTHWWHLTFKGAFTWNDGVAGSGSWDSRLALNSDIKYEDSASWSWAARFWPETSGTGVHTYQNLSAPFQNYTEALSSPPMLGWQHCDININTNYVACPSPDYYVVVAAAERRVVQTTIKLQTGGRASSKLRNVFGLSAGATLSIPNDPGGASPNCCGYYYMYWNTIGTNIPSQNITLGSVGRLPKDGTLYKVLPDNVDVDVTPTVANVDFYTFNIKLLGKYHSYFDVFVLQANPGFNFKIINGPNNAGHVFWRLRTDAPTNATQYLSPGLTNFLDQKWGFYPSGDDLYTQPGILQSDETKSTNICRTFCIGFLDLRQGLIQTKKLHDSPLVYNVRSFNCTGAAKKVGSDAGVVDLPEDITPQIFGIDLIMMYPAPGYIYGPFMDTNDVFYSSPTYH